MGSSPSEAATSTPFNSLCAWVPDKGGHTPMLLDMIINDSIIA